MSNLVEQVRDARKVHDIRDVLGVSSRVKWMICPLPQHSHSSNSPSFSIYVDEDRVQRFKCHGNCGLMGDVVDLVGFLHVPGYDKSDPRTVEQALGMLDAKYVWQPPVITLPPRLTPNLWGKFIPPGPRVIRYAETRGLTPETLTKFKVGQKEHWMSIPAFENGNLMGVKFRNIYSNEFIKHKNDLRFYSAKGSKKSLFNYDAVAFTQQPVLIVKGEIPVMLLDQYGLLACAPTGGEGAYIEEYVSVLALSEKKVVVGDNDEDPNTRAKMVAKAKYRANVLHAELRFPPEEYKDIDAWILADPLAIEEIRKWLYQ